MTAFWIMTALATAMAALLVLTGARRGVDAVVDGEPDAAARELAELDRLKARGLLSEDAWSAARAEAGRRLLATRSGPVELQSRPADRRWVLAGLILTAMVALGLYWAIGRPGYSDQTYDRRVEAWAESTEPLEAEQVAAVLTREARLRPDDRRILTMLGSARFSAEDPIGAASAFRRALAIDPDDARTWSRLGESLVRSQDGAVGADAEAAFREALKRDPGQLGALYFLGDAALKRADLAGATILWTPLIKALDPADPRRVDLERRLGAATETSLGAAG
jgi:cytochrome c-type biogenesis protein CcmH